jgi:A/G-specific adenine glycosylase
MQKFPNANKAAAADPNEVAVILHHLGLRHRIPRFIKLFKKLSTEYHGVVPHKYDQLITLPGVGRYVASAVLCFGFGMPEPVVDANVVRVLKRFFGLFSTKRRAHTDPAFWIFTRQLLPKNKELEFNEAIIDFAAMICKPKPQCNKCQFSPMCDYCNSIKNLQDQTRA